MVPLALMLNRIREDTADAEHRASARAGWIARSVARGVSSANELVASAAETIANLDDFWTGNDADRDRLLTSMRAAYPSVDGLVYFDADLERHAAAHQSPSAPEIGPEWRVSLAAAAAIGRPAFGEQLGPSSDGADSALMLTVPIEEAVAPHRSGFLVVGVRVERLGPVVGSGPSAEETAVLLVDDREGRAMALSAGRVARVSDADWADQLVASEPVPDSSWRVVVKVPAESLFGPIRNQAMRQALGVLGVSGLLAALLLLFWRRLRAQLQVLEDAAGHWAGGDLSYRARECGPDELGRVAHVFNGMADQLRELFARDQAVQNELLVARAALEQRVVERTAELHELLARLFSAQEEERRHVAIDVHDGVAQTAAAAHQRLESLAAGYRPRSPQRRRDLQRTRELARRTVLEARRIIAGLRPTVLDDFGLAPALQQSAEQLRADGWDVSCDLTSPSGRLAPLVETALYRVAQEALANARKHARAAHIQISLGQTDHTVRLMIADDGVGFERNGLRCEGADGEHVGLAGMHERLALIGGGLVVDSQPGGGTRVVAEVAVQ
jgi:signal transduction histidine kinase